MNDRYLFKAKRIDNGEWIQGYLFDNGFSGNTRYFVGGLIIQECKSGVCGGWYVAGIDFCEIDPTTLCQCTGLKDKNGTLIWENDIVLWRDKRYAVKWYDSIGSFVITLPSGHWNHMEINYGDKLECFDYEVIGSYIDNPELLEVE